MSLETVSLSLSQASITSPASFSWPSELDFDFDFFPEELISLSFEKDYQELLPAQKKLLGLQELCLFFSFSLHGENAILQKISLYQKDCTKAAQDYLKHFIAEEERHRTWFETFLQKYGRFYPFRDFAFAADPPALVFFFRIFIFEKIGLIYNQKIAKSAHLFPLIKDINQAHYQDESRHLRFGQELIVELAKATPKNEWATLKADALDYLHYVWRSLYSAEVYTTVGLARPYDLAQQAFDNPRALSWRQELSQSCLAFIEKIFPEEKL